ncbi:hypothetical protein [Sphingobium yanoikuyae]|uniref:hypothetical protein n=1 Tax=Sphingobium yanoikuyae TaxID=13690 RepID=UPI00345E4BAA
MKARAIYRLIGIALGLANALPASAETLPPKNECTGDKRFAAIVGHIADITRRRDGAGFMALVAPNVQIDFGGSEGKQAFAKVWHLDRGAKSAFWAELDTMLKLGCAVEKDWAAFPYLFARAPETDDVFSQYLVTGTNIAMRSSPRAGSKKIATLNWDVVTAASQDSTDANGWRHVTRSDGTRGYVSDRFLRSSVDYRLIIGFVRGKPMITHFIAGD